MNYRVWIRCACGRRLAIGSNMRARSDFCRECLDSARPLTTEEASNVLRGMDAVNLDPWRDE